MLAGVELVADRKRRQLLDPLARAGIAGRAAIDREPGREWAQDCELLAGARTGAVDEQAGAVREHAVYKAFVAQQLLAASGDLLWGIEQVLPIEADVHVARLLGRGGALHGEPIRVPGVLDAQDPHRRPGREAQQLFDGTGDLIYRTWRDAAVRLRGTGGQQRQARAGDKHGKPGSLAGLSAAST